MPTKEKKPVLEPSYYVRFVGTLYVLLFAGSLSAFGALFGGMLIKTLVQIIFFHIHQVAEFDITIAVCVFFVSFLWMSKEVPAIAAGTYRYQTYFEMGEGSHHWTGKKPPK